MQVSEKCYDLVKAFEGLRLNAYQDEVGVWTIGYGTTEGIQPGNTITETEALSRMQADVRKFSAGVEKALAGSKCLQSQFDAMVCFAYNIGLGWEGSVKPKGAKDGFRQSSVLKAHLRGDYQAAARAFALWNKSGGKVSNGLTRRRAAESALYLHDVVDTEAMPQDVDPEQRMPASTINRAGAAAGGTAILASAAEAMRTVTDVKHSLVDLGDWVLPLALLVIIGLCGYIIYERVKMRKGGWV